MKAILKSAVSLSVILTLILVFFPEAVFASADEIAVIQPDAEKVALNVSCQGVPSNQLSGMVDGNYYSAFQIARNVRIECKASVPVRSLYVMLEKSCEWTLSFPDGTEKKCGENGFLHEYIYLEIESNVFYIDLPAAIGITEVYAFTEGKLPDWVQIWQPPCKRADLMVMPAHADDEHLWFGGAMPYYAGELGYNVQVVYLTDHYKSPYRKHELLNGLWTVGVRNYPVLTDKFPDELKTKWSLEGAEEVFGRDNVIEFEVEMLRRFAPRVVIAHDINGEYGHGAHKLYAAALLDALKIYDDPTAYPDSTQKYGVRKVQKCYLHLWEENPIVVNWSEMSLSHFGGQSAFDMALTGYKCHRSQQRFNIVMEESGPNDCRKFGLAYTTVGLDTPGLNDMFEHVDMTDEEADNSIEQENPDAAKQKAESVSETDAGSKTRTSDKKFRITLFGKELMINDVVVAAAAVIVSFTAIISVICLKRRE